MALITSWNKLIPNTQSVSLWAKGWVKKLTWFLKEINPFIKQLWLLYNLTGDNSLKSKLYNLLKSKLFITLECLNADFRRETFEGQTFIGS